MSVAAIPEMPNDVRIRSVESVSFFPGLVGQIKLFPQKDIVTTRGYLITNILQKVSMAKAKVS